MWSSVFLLSGLVLCSGSFSRCSVIFVACCCYRAFLFQFWAQTAGGHLLVYAIVIGVMLVDFIGYPPDWM